MSACARCPHQPYGCWLCCEYPAATATSYEPAFNPPDGSYRLEAGGVESEQAMLQALPATSLGDD